MSANIVHVNEKFLGTLKFASGLVECSFDNNAENAISRKNFKFGKITKFDKRFKKTLSSFPKGSSTKLAGEKCAGASRPSRYNSNWNS